MCRLLGVVSSETCTFGFSLHQAPRSLSALSSAHPDGWGLAVHGEAGWELHKYVGAAHRDERFLGVAARARGELMVAHIRKRTVGPISALNTHPFRRANWVFAHNGTIEDVSFLAENTSESRAREVEGDTDSERFFAYLLTALDGAPNDVVGSRAIVANGDFADDGLIGNQGTSSIALDRSLLDATLVTALRAMMARPRLGAANFLLSDGDALYAFRFGRTLYLLPRHRGDLVRERRSSPDTHAEIETPWSVRRRAFIVASEKMTDEPFRELAEGTLIRIDSGSDPRVTVLFGSIAE